MTDKQIGEVGVIDPVQDGTSTDRFQRSDAPHPTVKGLEPTQKNTYVATPHPEVETPEASVGLPKTVSSDAIDLSKQKDESVSPPEF